MQKINFSIASRLFFLVFVFGTSFLASLATVAGGYLLKHFFPLSLFEGTMVFAAMLLIGIVGCGLMSIVDCMRHQFHEFAESEE